MDHLPTSIGQYPYLNIPCVCTEDYDGLEFVSYPERRGFDVDRFGRGDFSEHAAEKSACFLQNWLFFGVLGLVFRHSALTQISSCWIRVGIDGNRFIETKLLDEDWFREWLSWLYGLSEKERNDQIRNIEASLVVLHTFIDLLAIPETCPLPEAVVTSFRILGVTIEQAACWRYAHLIPERDWGLKPIARRLMWDRGWCVRDITLAEQTLSSSSLFWASHLGRQTTAHAHSKCSETFCAASQIDEDTYQTRHRTPECPCNHICPDMNEIKNILDKGQVPILEIKAEKSGQELSQPTVSVKSATTTGPYIAISHVWSDGLGSVTNSLPSCQLLWLLNALADIRFYETFHKLDVDLYEDDDVPGLNTLLSWAKKGVSLYRSARRYTKVTIWLDTLCIPRERDYRKMAIQRMRDVYCKSYFTVALDAELYSMSGNRSDGELLLRILASSWGSRAWTMQESIFSNSRLQVKFADKLINLSELLRLDTKLLVGIENHVNNSSIVGLHERFARFAEEQLPSAHIRDMNHESGWKFSLARLAFRELQDGFKETTGLWYLPADKDDNEERVRRMTTTWELLRWRATTREEDKITIFMFACIMNGEDIKVANTALELPPKDRMKYWFSRQKVLPSNLVYVKGKRIEEAGFGWAPSGIHPYTLQLAVYDSGDEREPGSRELVLTNYNGYFLTLPSIYAFASSFIVFDREYGIRSLVTIDSETMSEEQLLSSGSPLGLQLHWGTFQSEGPGILLSVHRREDRDVHCKFIARVDVKHLPKDGAPSDFQVNLPDIEPIRSGVVNWYIG